MAPVAEVGAELPLPSRRRIFRTRQLTASRQSVVRCHN